MSLSESARRLRVPGYLVMAAITIVQVVDVGIRAWPFRLHSPAWRLGVIGFAANAVGTPMLALLARLEWRVVTDRDPYLLRAVKRLDRLAPSRPRMHG